MGGYAVIWVAEFVELTIRGRDLEGEGQAAIEAQAGAAASGGAGSSGHAGSQGYRGRSRGGRTGCGESESESNERPVWEPGGAGAAGA